MSFTAAPKPATGARRTHRLSDDEVKAAAAIIKKGHAAKSDPVKGRKNCQTLAWGARRQLAEAMGVETSDLLSRTEVEDQGKDLYRYLVFRAEEQAS
jgi:hypothetical protein